MQVTFTKTATKDIAKLPLADAKAIVKKLNIFATTGAGDVKKLKGRTELRLRYGKYRALFTQDGVVLVIRVGHRKNIY